MLPSDVVNSMLKDVPFDGWTDEVFAKALNTLSVSKADEIVHFPNGLKDAVEYFSRSIDDAMMQKLDAQKISSLRIRDRIKTAIRTRIELYPSKAVVSKTLAYYAVPTHAMDATQSLFTTVDAMWRMAGDQSTDFNYYTKRLVLAGVLSSTMLYWLSDDSENDQDTWEFLDRRIDNVMQITKAKESLKDLPKKIPFLRMLWSK
jgi:ubiquinone biosynthesis protein COQ9